MLNLYKILLFSLCTTALSAYQVTHLDPSFEVDNSVRFGKFTSDADMAKDKNGQPIAKAVVDDDREQDQPLPSQRKLGLPLRQKVKLIDVNFSDATLASVFKIIAEKNNWNYTVPKELQNMKISLKMDHPVSLDEAWNIFLTLLDMYEFTHVKVDNLHKIMPKAQAGTEPFEIYSSAQGVTPDDLPENMQQIRYIYYLKNLRFEVAASILGVLLTEKVQTVADLDVCIIKDKSLAIKNAFKIIKELDEGGVRQSISIVPLNYADPEYVVKFLNDNFIDNKPGPGERIRFVGGNKKSVAYFSQDVKILSNKFHNVVILLGPEKDVDRFVNFIKVLIDRGPEQSNSRIRIKDIKYHDAGALKKLLDSLIKPVAGNQQQTYFKDTPVIMAESPKSNSGGDFTSGNRLIIASMPEDWDRLEKLIDDIDKPQAQVALEVMVIDTGVDFNEELEAHIRDTGLGLVSDQFSWRVNNYATQLNFPSSGFTPRENILGINLNEGASTGNSWAVLGNTPDGADNNNAWAFVRALATKDNSAVIAQPFLITNNNQTATFTSTDKLRVDGEFVNSNSRVSRKNEYLPATTAINITPRVNSTGIVDLDIDISVADFTSRDKAQAKTNQRTLETKATMGLGEVLILGGLVKSRMARSEYKTPILGDIPVLGLFFRGRSKHTIKSKLYIFIRPTVIKPRVHSEPDDYTSLKLKYAKYQIGNVNTYAQSKDPIEHFFFKPAGHTIKQTIDDYKNNRFEYVDNFVERKTMPTSTLLDKDKFYAQVGQISETEKAVSQSSVLANSAAQNSNFGLDLESRV